MLKITLEKIGNHYGVSKRAVAKQAKKHGGMKTISEMLEILNYYERKNNKSSSNTKKR